MRRAGVNQASVRTKLARRTREIHSLIGPTLNPVPLLPLIAADPTGSYKALSTTWVRPWIRGLALVGAGAMVVLVALGIRNAARSNAAIPTEQWTPTLSSDALGPDTGAEPQQVVIPLEPAPLPAARQQPPPEVEPLEAIEDEPTPAKRKRVGTKRDPLAEFKGNPYD